MLLKSLEIQGFKTFPDKLTLNFNEGITAVVGPNGSGKSNISDAIRWVLGEQSTKVLRCSKMENVVFEGTDLRKSKGFAKVRLTMDNSDRSLNVDTDEVALTRKYYRSGESEYMINNKTVRLKDINELFMDTGLGKDGYSIIGQGKIDEIVSSKSGERREIFEEAAGISKFRYRKADAQKQLAKAEENLIRLNDIFSELEQRIEPLKNQAEKAKKFLRYSDEKKELEISVWMDSISSFNKKLKEQEDKIFIVKQRETENNAEAKQVEQALESLSAKAVTYSAKVNRTRDEITQKERLLAQNQSSVSVNKNNIFHNKKNAEKLKSDLALSEAQGKNSESKIELQKQKIQALQAEIITSDKDLNDKKAELESIENKIEQKNQTSKELNEQLEQLKNSLSDVKLGAVSLLSGIKDLTQKDTELKTALTDKEKLLDDLKNTKDKYKKICLNIDNKQEEIKNNITNIKDKLQTIENKISTEDKAISDIVAKADEKLRQADILENLEKNMDGYSKSVKFVMRASNDGTLNGIHMPVSRLIKVEDKYKTAIETALGMSAQHIVCRDESSAKSAINLLKRKNIGRATFLPISVIKGRSFNLSEISNLNGFIDMANTLCKCEDKYRNIISNLLGRVAIVDNIDNAIYIAKQIGYKIKIVTLDGQVINPGGSLTGGALSKISGLLSHASDIASLRANAEKLKLSTEEIKQKKLTLLEEKSEFEKLIFSNENEINIFEKDKIRIQTENGALNREINRVCDEIDQIKSTQTALTLKLQRATEDKISTESRRLSTIKQLKTSQEQLSDTNDELDALRKSKEKLKEDINDEKIKNISLKKDLQGLQDKIEEIKSQNNEVALKIIQITEELKEIEKSDTLLSEEIVRLSDEIAQIEKDIRLLNDDIQITSSKLLENEKNTVKLREKEKQILRDHEDITRDLIKFEGTASTLKQSYDGIIAKLWDEYEITLSEAQSMNIKVEDIGLAKKHLAVIKGKIKQLGSVNVSALEEYKEVSERYEFMKDQIYDVKKSKSELLKQITSLTLNMEERFRERFDAINNNFKEIFYELFSGGSAMLELTDESDILNCGINIKVKPPGKVVSHLELLSGGEKAMVSIVLYFAIMKVNPPPFCVLDEIEAALDDLNIERFITYLKKINKDTQFIIITHRRGTMEQADILYGVTMQEKGISKILQLNATEISEKLNIF